MSRPLPDHEPDDGATPADLASAGTPAGTDGSEGSLEAASSPAPGSSEGSVEADPAHRPVPSAAELEKIAVDVRIRRRPRYGVFIATGMVLAGAAVFVWAASVPHAARENWGASVWVATLTAAALGALLGAGAAVFADWRSGRK